EQGSLPFGREAHLRHPYGRAGPGVERLKRREVVVICCSLADRGIGKLGSNDVNHRVSLRWGLCRFDLGGSLRLGGRDELRVGGDWRWSLGCPLVLGACRLSSQAQGSG